MVLDWLPFLPAASVAAAPVSLLGLILWLMAEKRLTDANDEAVLVAPPLEES